MKRLASPLNGFWKKVRNAGLIITAVSAVILTAPISLPIALVTVATYAAVGGGVLVAAAQATKADE